MELEEERGGVVLYWLALQQRPSIRALAHSQCRGGVRCANGNCDLFAEND